MDNSMTYDSAKNKQDCAYIFPNSMQENCLGKNENNLQKLKQWNIGKNKAKV